MAPNLTKSQHEIINIMILVLQNSKSASVQKIIDYVTSSHIETLIDITNSGSIGAESFGSGYNIRENDSMLACGRTVQRSVNCVAVSSSLALSLPSWKLVNSSDGYSIVLYLPVCMKDYDYTIKTSVGPP